MEIWKPKWEAYKKTDSYKEFCLLKQELCSFDSTQSLYKCISEAEVSRLVLCAWF